MPERDNFFTHELYQYYSEQGKNVSENVVRILGKSPHELNEEDRATYQNIIEPARQNLKQALINKLNQSERSREAWQEQLIFYSESIIGQMAAEVLIETEALTSATIENLLDDPNVKGLVINSRDVTRRKQAERLVRVQRDLAIKLSGTSDPTEVLETSLKAILEASGLDCGAIQLFNEDTERLELACCEGVSEAFAGEIAHYDPDSPIALLVKAGNPVYTNPREMDLPKTDARVKEGIKAVAIIPVKSDGDVIGSVSVASHILDEIPRHSIDIIDMLAGQIGEAIARSRLASALRDSEEKFRLLHDQAGEAIFTYDRDMKIMSVNRIGCEEIGYSEEELIGKSILELGILQPDEIEKAATNFQELMLSGKPVRAEYKLTRRDGSPFYVNNTATPLYNEKGELIAISNIALDITKKREAEETLRRSEEHFRTLIEKAFDVITILDGTGVIRYESPSIKEVLGYEQDELVGKSIFDYLHPEDMQVTLEAFSNGLEIPGNSSNMEVRFRHKDGSWRWFSGTGSNFLNDPVIQGVLLNSRDVTESKQIDRILRESEGKYRATFESTGTAMFLVDKDAVISDANREMEKTFGYSHEEVAGRMRYMEFLMPEDVELVKVNSLKLMRGELEGPIQYEVKARHKTGRIIEALISINVLPEIDKSVVSLIDITEKKNYERELLERADQLKDFLDIAAHELRHPTTLLKGYALTLKKHWETLSPETLKESLEAMGIGADRLVHVVQELLDMSRIERSSYPMVKEEVALEPLVERAVNEMLAKDSDVEIKFEFRGRFDLVNADPESLVRLLIILLDNAVKYSPPGSLVEVIVEKDDENLIISVLDRGTGVPEEERESIFERFYQVEEVLHHSHPGLGLGLYIGRRIVEEHGGKIWYEPREGGGTAFRFTLPLDEALPQHMG